MELRIPMTKILFYTTAGLAVLALLFSLVLGDSKDSLYYWGTLAALPFSAISIYFYTRYKGLQHLKDIREHWGKESKRKRDYAEISHCFRASAADNEGVIDDNTWYDLNMDELFARIDRTLTSPGSAMLYRLLRTPCTGKNARELEHRNQVIAMLHKEQTAREKLQLALLKMGRDRSQALAHLLWDPLPAKNPLAWLYTGLALAALLALLSPLILGTRGIMLIMISFSVNSMVHYRVRKKYSYHIPSITSLAALLRSAKAVIRAEIPGLERECRDMKAPINSSQKILRKLRNLFLDTTPSSDLFFAIQYIQILFLVEVRSFYGALEEIKRQLKELRNIYCTIGLLDALQAAASYREGLDWVEPEFIIERRLQVENIRHPLLAKPVPNSLDIHNQGILITGSNMAGKSTFLRTLGINVILAQTFCTCLANVYRACFLQVATSINKADNISQQKSLYYAEAERLLKIIHPDYSKLPGLILIDELLSGTNYTERLAASSAILNYLKTKNALVMVATHDLDLAENLGAAYQCYHFSDKMDRDNLAFDYTLKRGIADTRNAIKLLEHLGYPPEIIQNASR